MTSYADSIRSALDAALRETGAQLQRSTADVAAYTASRAAHLAAIAGQPGVDEAVIAERDAVWLYAAGRAVASADAADARVIGLIHGALAVAMAAG